MYQVELSEAAAADLADFSNEQLQEIYAFLLSLEENPTPAGTRAFQLEEAADYTGYLYETAAYEIYYNIFELAQVVKVVGIFRRISLS